MTDALAARLELDLSAVSFTTEDVDSLIGEMTAGQPLVKLRLNLLMVT